MRHTPRFSCETIVKLADGRTLRSAGERYEAGAYVRLCSSKGRELLYWSCDEWATDPELVMGAIMRAAAGVSASRPKAG